VKSSSLLRLAVLAGGYAWLSVCGAAELSKATLHPTYTLDLEAGKIGVPREAQDLFWQARTSSERCLGPVINSRVLLAPLPEREFNDADGARLAGLTYSARCYAHTNSGGELQRGYTFAVRTVEGNFAKVRVAGINSRNHLELEWRVYPPPAATAKGTANPSLDIPALFAQARQHLRSQRQQDAVPLLQEAVALAEALPAGARRAEALGEAGSLLWSANRRDLSESALLAAARQMENLPASAVPLESRSRTFRMLGIVYRDLGRAAEAIPWFERALTANEAMPESSPQAAGLKYFNMASNLNELAGVHCRAGHGQDAEATDQRRLDTCARTRSSASVGACREARRSCIDGWMRDSVASRPEGKKQ
jgi:tetratricopeptide (TPR) repeat protein